MSNVVALIPARYGSKGIPNKNFRRLVAGVLSPVDLAIRCAEYAKVPAIVVTTDASARVVPGRASQETLRILKRPAEFAQDDTPMIDVVKHALQEISGPPDQIIVLLQPTQPLRTPAHVQAAIALLQETQADSVVSVVQLPPTHSPAVVMEITDEGRLKPWRWLYEYCGEEWETIPTTRQTTRSAYMRDGTAYCFWRRTVERYSNIYGQDVRPLIISPDDTCSLDTLVDWAEAERRLREREAHELDDISTT